MIRLVVVLVLFASTALAAVTYPTAPRSVPDIRVAASLCTITIANEAAFQAYLTGNTRTNCVTGGNGPPTLGDRVELAAGVTFGAATEHLLPDPVGTLANGSDENYVTITSGSGATCPAEGTRVIGPNDPWGRTANIASLAKIKSAHASTASYQALRQGVDGIDHYRLYCLEFDGNTVAGYQGIVSLEAETAPGASLTNAMFPSYIVFERNYIKPTYDFGARKGLKASGSHIKIVDNYFNDVKSTSSADANALWIQCGNGPFLVRNNDFGGLGENFFVGGGPNNNCPHVTEGYEYEVVTDLTFTYNFLYRETKWKRDDATYEGPANAAGTGTVSSSGNNVTFSTSQTGLTNQWVRGNTSGHKIKLTAGSGTSWSGTWVSGFSAFSAGENFTYSSSTLEGKNCYETKSAIYVEVAYNLCTNVWKDGQLYDLTLTPREFGYIKDWNVHDNLFYQTSGPSLPTPGDNTGGNGFGPSPYPTLRVWVHNNAWVDVAKTTMQSLVSSIYYGGILGGFTTYQYGMLNQTLDGGTAGASGSGTVSSSGTTLTFLNDQTGLAGTCIRASSPDYPHGQTVKVSSGSNKSWVSQHAFSPALTTATFLINVACIEISATSGNNRTVTAIGGAPFDTYMDGNGSNMCLVYMNGFTSNSIIGKATIKTYTDTSHLTVDITQAFPDTNAHTPSWYGIGKCDLVGTMYYTMDSYVYEHNGVYPGTSGYQSPWLMLTYYPITGGQNKATNFVFRDNAAGNGFDQVNSNGGLYGDNGNGTGTTQLLKYADSATLVAGNNVLWGAETMGNGLNSQQYYTGALLACAGPDSFATTCKTAFHDVTYAGGGGTPTTGSVGFADYPNWNLHIAGTYATAAHDGTQIGPDLTELYHRTAYTFQGTPYNSGGLSAISGSSGAHAISGSSGRTTGGGCVRGLISAFDSGC